MKKLANEKSKVNFFIQYKLLNDSDYIVLGYFT